MKKVVFGSILSMSGMISSAILISSAISHEWINNDEYSWFWNLSRYGAESILGLFIFIIILGIILAVWGVVER